jgi:hypothetical protein
MTVLEKINYESVIHDLWKTDKCLKRHIEKHVEARSTLQATFPVPNEEAIRSFQYSLSSLLCPTDSVLLSYGSTVRMLHPANDTSFIALSTAWLKAIRDNRFPGLVGDKASPSVNKIVSKDDSKKIRSFAEKSNFYKEKHKEADADGDCPVHSKKNTHKWCDCDYYIGKQIDRKKAK